MGALSKGAPMLIREETFDFMYFDNPELDSLFELSETMVSLGMKEDKSKPVAKVRTKAVMNTLARVRHYREKGIRNDVIHAVFEKRMALIMKADTVKELNKIMEEPKPYYNGSGFVASEYSVPEEEMILWSFASLNGGGPLNQPAQERYISLFKQFFGADPTDPKATFSFHSQNQDN